jgi:peptidyl-prolyl cis-trans isomerase SurA
MRRRQPAIPDNERCLQMEQMMAVKAMVLQAEKDSLIVSDEELEGLLENQVRGFIQQYGGKENLEQIAGRTVYQIKEDFRQSFKEKKQAELMRNKIVEGIKMTPIEATAYFNKIPKDSLAFRIKSSDEIILCPANREIENTN